MPAVPLSMTPIQTASYLPPSSSAPNSTNEQLQPRTIQLLIGAFGYRCRVMAPRIQRPSAVITLGKLMGVGFGRVAPIGFDYGGVTAIVTMPPTYHNVKFSLPRDKICGLRAFTIVIEVEEVTRSFHNVAVWSLKRLVTSLTIGDQRSKSRLGLRTKLSEGEEGSL
ncbi:hypothetical protein C8J56DRAFT_1019375 [Mycena floridula]|nr:hypothetical protein C8J56DRAFT_1019375 [Mycena floridula]